MNQIFPVSILSLLVFSININLKFSLLIFLFRFYDPSHDFDHPQRDQHSDTAIHQNFHFGYKRHNYNP